MKSECHAVKRDRDTTHLKPFPNLIVAFEFILLLFLLQWSQNNVPSEEMVGVIKYLELLEFPQLVFVFKFCLPLLLGQS